MPLDTSVTQDVLLEARQVGGRVLEPNSLCWLTLFPAPKLQIEGRVPVDNSAQYLTQMRLNSLKELIAVALTPREGTDGSALASLMDFLIAKQ